VASSVKAQLKQCEKTIGGTNDDEGYSIIQTIDGGYAMAGYTKSFGAGNFDVYVVKLDLVGNLKWTKTIGGTNDDRAYSIVQTNDKGYAIAGYTASYGAGGNDVYVIKLDSAGNLKWTKTIGGPNDDMGYSIVQTQDKGYIIGGYTDSYGAGLLDIYLVKLDSAGNLKWTKTIGGSRNELAWSVIQTKDKGYAIAGYTDSYGAGSEDVYVVKLDSTGSLKWTKTIGGVNNDYGWSIVQTNDNGYAIGGYTDSHGSGGYDVYVIKLDSAGGFKWDKTIGGTLNDVGYSIVQTSDKGLAVAGYTLTYSYPAQDVYVVKLDSLGNLKWTKGIGGLSYQYGTSIIQTSDKGLAIGGYTASYGSGSYDLYFIKFDSLSNLCHSSIIDSGMVRSGGSLSNGGSVTSINNGQVNSGGVAGSGGILSTVCTVASLFATITQTGLRCDSACTGKATALPGGGTPPYSYNWAPGGSTNATVSNLCVGIYTCTVTDATAKSVIVHAIITQYVHLKDSISVKTNACSGGNSGSLSVGVSGGTGLYTYLWSPGGATTAVVTGLSAGCYTVTVNDSCGVVVTDSACIIQPVRQLYDSISLQANDQCYGISNGLLIAGVKGGIGAYTYSWTPTGGTNNNITGLSPGCYTLTVTDSIGCRATTSACITQPTQLRDSISSTNNVKCFGDSNGSLTIGVTGGSQVYTYAWSNGASTSIITGLTSGNYSITVTDAHGCSATANATITQPPQLSFIDSVTNEMCFGGHTGSVTAFIAGGTAPYNYLWHPTGGTSSSDNSLTVGNYVCTVTDNNGCVLYDSVTITQPPALMLRINANPDSVCPGDCSIISATGRGGTPLYTYAWSNGATTSSISICPATTNTYSVVLTDSHGCTQDSTITIFVNPKPVASITFSPNPPNGNRNLTLSDTTKDSLIVSWDWHFGDGNSFINGHDSILHTYPGYGQYHVLLVVTDIHGCTDTISDSINIGPTGINNINYGSKVNVYPNPNDGKFTIQLSTFSEPMMVVVYNMLGEQVCQHALNGTNTQIEIDSKATGIYLYRVLTETGNLVSEGKFMVQK